MTARCVRCHASFTCSGVTGTCWCMHYPAALTLPCSKACFCPACLRQTIQAKIEAIDDQVVHITPPSYAETERHKPAIEGLDYVIDAQGRWVFSRWFLLKQGQCCGNSCLNCPYGRINVGRL